MAARKGSKSNGNIASKKVATNIITERKSKSKGSKPMKQIFRGKIFSFSGDFGENWAHEQMAGWIKAHGGQYEREVSANTTHLICTVEHYKKKTDQIKRALAIGKQCHIVNKDWLEDCLVCKPSKKRCRPEKDYTLNKVLKRVNDGLKEQKGCRLKFGAAIKASYELVDNLLNHVYCDQTGFEYEVVCTRLNTDGKVKSEKYTIYLLESNAKPSHYMAGAKLTSPGRRPSYWRTECHPKTFFEAYSDFTGWFKNITGIEWDDRLDELLQDPEKFRYNAPKLGRPVGALPPGKNPPSWRDNEVKSEEVHDTGSEAEDGFGSEHTSETGEMGNGSPMSISSHPSPDSGCS